MGPRDEFVLLVGPGGSPRVISAWRPRPTVAGWAARAMVATVPDCVVDGEHVDVMVVDDFAGPGLEATSTGVRLDDPATMGRVAEAADRVLAAQGWARSEEWHGAAFGLCAAVRRCGDKPAVLAGNPAGKGGA